MIPNPFATMDRTEAIDKLNKSIEERFLREFGMTFAWVLGKEFIQLGIYSEMLLMYPYYRWALINRLMYYGDHWINGMGWVGPMPEIDDQAFDWIHNEIRDSFCSANVIKEVIDRKVDGLLKSEPMMLFVREEPATDKNPITDADKDLINEAISLFQPWWNKREGLNHLKEIMRRCNLGEEVCVRFYIPPGLVEPDGKGGFRIPPQRDMAGYADMLHLQIVDPGQAGIINDKRTQYEAAVYNSNLEGFYYTEIVYINDQKQTVVKVQTDASFTEEAIMADEQAAYTFELGGHLTIHRPKIRGIISPQVRENQMAINLAKTMASKNIISAGFLERIITDAMPPGKWIDDPDNPGKQKYQAEPMRTGGNTTNFLGAMEYIDEATNEKKIGSPRVHFREPSDAGMFIKMQENCYADILKEVGQPHVLVEENGYTSGISKVQAREIFRATLEDDENELNRLMVWLMETFIWMCSYLNSEPSHFQGIRAKAVCFLDAGPLAGTERADMLKEVESGLLSVKTAMARNGVEDPDAELAQIAAEAQSAGNINKMKAEITRMIAQSGGDVQGAMTVAGFEKADVDRVTQVDVIKPPTARSVEALANVPPKEVKPGLDEKTYPRSEKDASI